MLDSSTFGSDLFSAVRFLNSSPEPSESSSEIRRSRVNPEGSSKQLVMQSNRPFCTTKSLRRKSRPHRSQRLHGTPVMPAWDVDGIGVHSLNTHGLRPVRAKGSHPTSRSNTKPHK